MQAQRWAEHFTEAPTITADQVAPNDNLDIATGVPTLQEVTHAMKQIKTGKSPGTASKIFCRVLLNRIEWAIDVNLHQEQSGFRRGKGCMDQIFSLRKIIEQSTEWNSPLYIGFIDFNKAFDSIHHETL